LADDSWFGVSVFRDNVGRTVLTQIVETIGLILDIPVYVVAA
jgi:hypothetical protein